jgi:hypothetical protein
MRSLSAAVWNDEAWVLAKRSASSSEIGLEVWGVGEAVWACKTETQMNANITARGISFGLVGFRILFRLAWKSIAGPTLMED